MISVNDLRTGLTIELDGDIFTVVEFLHVKPGKGAAFVRTKLKNIRTGSSQEKTFRAGEKVARAHIETKKMQYMYNSGDEFFFMDTGTFDQISLGAEDLGNAPKFLLEQMVIGIQFYQNQAIGVDLPTTVNLRVVETEPGFKGDTAQGATKPAKLETGLVVHVPLFVEQNELVKVDTRSGEYLSRA